MDVRGSLPALFRHVLAMLVLTAILLATRASLAEARKLGHTATFQVTMQNGKVDSIAIRVAATGDYYLIDRFIDEDADIQREAEAFRNGFGGLDCRLGDRDRQCRTTCAWAENARPFTRIRRRSADGRLRALWPVGKEKTKGLALRFYAGASSRSSRDGDCVSPDGRFISLFGYPAPFDGQQNPAPGIYSLEKNLPYASFRGIFSKKKYGEDRYFVFSGWGKGESHTLLFNWGGEGGPIDDRALPHLPLFGITP